MSRHTRSEQNVFLNATSLADYYNYFHQLAISRFQYENEPDYIDFRYMEHNLYHRGMMALFFDEILEKYLCLPCGNTGNRYDVYGNPTGVQVYGENGYTRMLKHGEFVIIYNNALKCPSSPLIRRYCKMITKIDRTIEINVNACKQPILLDGAEEERLSMENLFREYDGNKPVIRTKKGMGLKNMEVLNLEPTYNCDKLFELKQNYWNECLTTLGIPNISYNKRERMVSDEVNRGMGGCVASRYSFLDARKRAFEDFNKLFGENVEVKFNPDIIDEYEDDYTDEFTPDKNEPAKGESTHE